MSPVERSRVIARASAVGIIGNIVLTILKAFVGILSNSIAIIVDAVNNLTDVAASAVTLLGAKLAHQKPDKKHPMGHGRFEYLSALLVAALIMCAGLTAFIESVRKVIHPVVPDYSSVAILVIMLSIVVKMFLASFMTKRGTAIASQALIGSGIDARNDVFISLSVLFAALVYLFSGFDIQAYVGIVIAIVICKSGYDLIIETVDTLLGHRIDHDLSLGIKHTVEEDPDVRGAYDLRVDNYGPELLVGQIHVEVDDTMTAASIEEMSRRIQAEVIKKHNVALTTIGIYDYDTQDEQVAIMREKILEVVMQHPGIMQAHGFHVNREAKMILFDLIVDYAIDDRRPLYDHIVEDINDLYPDYTVVVTLDRDLSD